MMEEIVKQFIQEVNYIDNSTMFMKVDENEPITEWVEEIDSRTNFSFYWNSNTNESVWDKPESYDGYLIEYEKYLTNVMENEFTEKAIKDNENEVKKRSDMRGLLGYSDSEDECDEVDKMRENMSKEYEKINIEPAKFEEEESISCQRDQWITEQISLATQYLRDIIKSKSELAVAKIQSLIKEVPNSESLMPVGLQVQTRLEDWEGGHLTIERTVEKLQEALIKISEFEGNLESSDWKLQWDREKMKYYFINTKTGVKKLNFVNGKNNYEDGEIVDDDDDLRDYVTSTLQRSLLQTADNVILDQLVDRKSKEESSFSEFIIEDNSKINVKGASNTDITFEKFQSTITIDKKHEKKDLESAMDFESSKIKNMLETSMNEIGELKMKDETKVVDDNEVNVERIESEEIIENNDVKIITGEDIVESKYKTEDFTNLKEDSVKIMMNESILKNVSKDTENEKEMASKDDEEKDNGKVRDKVEDSSKIIEEINREDCSEMLDDNSVQEILQDDSGTLLESIKRSLIDNIDKFMMESLKEQILEEEMNDNVIEDLKENNGMEEVLKLREEDSGEDHCRNFGSLVDYQDEEMSEEEGM